MKNGSAATQKTSSKISGKINRKNNFNSKSPKTHGLVLFFTSIFIFLSLFFLASCGLFYYGSQQETGSSQGTIKQNIQETSSITLPSDKYDEPKIDRASFYDVKEIIDGDTFSISNGQKVRLIGINTPEYGMFYYEEAKDVLSLIIKNKNVFLEKDISDIDDYGRLLRYAYYGQLFVNLEMVLRGFANSFTYPPDIKYQEKFVEAEKYARANNLGLWAISPFSDLEIDIIINPDAKGKDTENINGEFVKIKNNSKKDINIGGWTLKDSSTSIYEFYGYILRQGNILILYSGKGKDSSESLYWGSDVPIWNNEHDSLYLRDRDGLLIKYINY